MALLECFDCCDAEFKGSVIGKSKLVLLKLTSVLVLLTVLCCTKVNSGKIYMCRLIVLPFVLCHLCCAMPSLTCIVCAYYSKSVSVQLKVRQLSVSAAGKQYKEITR